MKGSKQAQFERLRGDIAMLESHIDDYEELLESQQKKIDRLASIVAVHEEYRRQVRDWWKFDSQQVHTHSWHDREEFIKRWGAALDAASKINE